jgi:hypothetical protein
MAVFESLASTRLATDTAYSSGVELFDPTTSGYLVSVIVTNTNATTANAYVYTIPDSATSETEWALLAYNLPISGYNTYETFRFTVNANESLYVAGSAGLNFYAQGIEQEVV